MSTSFLGNMSVVAPAMGLVTALVILTGLLFAVVSVLVYRPLRLYFAVRRAEARLKQLQLEFERTWWPLELLRDVQAIRLWGEDHVRRDVAAHFSELTEDTLRFTWQPTLPAAVFRWQAMCARLYAAEQRQKLWEMRQVKLRDLCLAWARDQLDEARQNADRMSLTYGDREAWILYPTLPACFAGIKAELVQMEGRLDRDLDTSLGQHLTQLRCVLAQIKHLIDPPRERALAA